MPEPICSPDDLRRALNSRENLYSFLHQRLHWNVDEQDTFAYEDTEAVGRARSEATLSQILPFSAGDPFILFLVEFQKTFRRGDLREILRGVRKRIKEEAAYNTADLDDLIFVCTVPKSESHPPSLQFVRFEEREGRQPKLRVFGYDETTVEEAFTLRTVNLPLLRLTTNLMGEVDWSACRQNWQDAWSVEKVTRQFFRDYKRVFETVRDTYITGVTGEKQLFTQRLFNRLLFIHFLSKKGWLEYNGDKNYLFALHAAAKANGENLYHDRLYWAFFSGLGVQAGAGASADTHSIDQLVAVRGKVPYLNGGLFEMEPRTDKEKKIPSDDEWGVVSIDNAAFDLIFGELFSCYNFTVAESTPDDQDVAVDPEMLGKVFEELVTGRHESGSYYTPRPVVQFMCRESLKGYLAPCGPGIDTFVDFHDASEITNHEVVLAALRSVKVVDPACGSGAYLLGMLQELMALRLALFNAKHLGDESTYNRKLEIIQNSLYGVDIDPFAVHTARLRLWLSLVVEDQRDPINNPKVSVALPNLDFKIECGDSVSCPDPSGGLQLDMYREHDLRDLATKQTQHSDVRYKGDKPTLKREIDDLSRTIKRESKLDEDAFDWRVDFGPVFQPQESDTDLGGAMNFGGTLAALPEPGGFDIVLANPPYVRGELIKDLKPTLKRVYGDRFGGTMDLYCFFYFRAIELLKDGGQLVFITPNKWFRAGYGEKLRGEIAAKCQVRSITDFGDLPVFESATAYPMIFIAQKGHSGTGISTWLSEPKTLEFPYPDVRAVVEQTGFALSASAITSASWNLSNATSSDLIEKMRANGVPLGEYVNQQIFYGIKTGFNTAFVIDSAKRAELIAADPKSEEIIKPLAVGKDVKRWYVDRKDQWLIFTRRGIDITRYPAIEAHLSKWKSELTPKGKNSTIGRKPGSYKWYEIQDEVAYHNEFTKPKILYQEIATFQSFAFARDELYVNNKVFLISSDDLFLLGVLNSTIVWHQLHQLCSKLQGNALAMQRPYLEQVIIPTASDTEKAAISALVQQCLDKRGQDVAEIEAEINARVAALYGLDK
jgi:type I restriction-modification system DNA methylase subunit